MDTNILRYYKITHVFVFVLLFSFIFFATPTADDYIFTPTNHTDGLFDTILGFLNNWGVRYSVPLVNYLWYKTLNGMSLPYFTGLILDFLIFAFGVWCAVKCAVSSTISVRNTLLTTFLLIVGIIRGLPTLDESIYWHATGISYMTAMGAMFTTVYLLFIISTNKYKKTILLTCILLIVYSSGIVEYFIIANITITSCYIVYTRCGIRHYILLLVAICCLLLTFVFTGNISRMSFYPNSGKFLYSLVYGGLFGTRSILQSIVDPYIWGSIILFSPFMSKLYHIRSLHLISLKVKLTYSAALVINLYAIPAIHYYGTGNPPVQRLMCIWYVLFFIGLLSLSVLFAPQLCKLADIGERKIASIIRRKISPKKVLLALSLLAFLCVNNPPKAIYDLIYNVPTFLQDTHEMHESIKQQQLDANNNGVLRLNEFLADPILLKTPLTADYGISNHYGFKKLEVIKTKTDD